MGSGGWVVENDVVAEGAELGDGATLDVFGAEVAQSVGSWIEVGLVGGEDPVGFDQGAEQDKAVAGVLEA